MLAMDDTVSVRRILVYLGTVDRIKLQTGG